MLLGIFAGMVPLLFAIVPFVLGRWGVGLVVVVGGSFVVLGWRLLRHKPVSGLDLTSLSLGVLLAIVYFGSGNLFFLKHFGVVIYSVLLIQVLYGEIRGQPFTAQYSKQMFSSEVQATRAFFEGNRFLSRLWGVLLGASILMAAFGTGALVLIVLPNALIVLLLLRGPALGHRYGARFLPEASPPPGPQMPS